MTREWFKELRLGEHILGVEGGYSNHASDRGGETAWGVTVAVARRYGYAGPMIKMTRDWALKIYEARYFKEPGLDRVADVFPELARELFDVAVNMGVSWPGTFLQTALNRLNRRAKDYPNLRIDGDLGPASIAALQAFKAKRGQAGERVLIIAVRIQKGARYFAITPEDDQNEDFFFGWLANRVVL